MIITLISCNGTSDKQSEKSDNRATPITSENNLYSEPLVDTQSITSYDNSAILKVKQKEKDRTHDFTYQIHNSNEPVNSSSGLAELFSYFDQPLQTYNINPLNDTVIIGEQGTIISISRNSFLYKGSQEPVTNEITITLKEYYKISDMLLANLSTMSNGEILETGGMIYLEATADNEELELRPDASIELKFPTQNKKDDMLLWYGSWNESVMNWELAEQKIDISNKVYENNELDTQAEFPGGAVRMMNFFSSNLRYPNDAREIGAQGSVFVEFIIDETGTIRDIEILRSVHPSLDSAAVRIIKKMPQWKPGTINGSPVTSKIAIPVRFVLNGGTTEDRAYAENFEKTVSDDTIHDLNIEDISYYIFSTQQLGWINVDKIIDNNNPRIDFTVGLEYDGNTEVKLVLRDYNSIFVRLSFEPNFVFRSIPTDIFARIIAIKADEGKYYISTKDIQIRENYVPELEFQLVTMDKLKEIIEELNIYSR